ncbi:DEAD/DEAH box helicase family protein [Glaciihabitans sp. UYNi722]|uniref:TOTE conflict system archaeo-eukaryotic primase domain-containing protein n=1 Tax=Glaciihabitans sp. UYNi722 TaxID=3156344 RepID=UPI003391BBEC
MALPNSHAADRITAARREIEDLESRIQLLKVEIGQLRESDDPVTAESETADAAPPLGSSGIFAQGSLTRNQGVDRHSPPSEKIALFLSLFAGRNDVYATRWVSAKTGKSGWSPAVRGGFYTDTATDSDFVPLTEQVVDQHLRGTRPNGTDFHVGLYPMTSNDMCLLLVCDFDDGEWRADAQAYVAACSRHGVPAAAEISRSGDGAHVWIFFSDAIPAHIARSLGSSLLREAMDIRGAMKLSSYDRFFPSQDLLPRKSPGRMRLGNLIALPLQGVCRANGTTVFADPATWVPYDDQFAYLAAMALMSLKEVSSLASKLRPVRTGPSASIATEQRRSTRVETGPVEGDTPRLGRIEIAVGSVISIPTAGLPTAVLAELKHIASLPNPEFFRRQAQRFSTFGTPRYVYCFEHDDTDLRLPRGLLDAVRRTMGSAKIRVDVTNTIPQPPAIALTFRGDLTAAQHDAVAVMLRHDTGVLVAPPGFGKTVMACASIARRGLPTAILVNRAELATQWRERLTQFLDIDPKQIGQFGAGRIKRKGLVDIVMLQSITRRHGDPTILDEYGYVIVDECHALGAPSTEAAIRQVGVAHWLGLTATPYRADQMDDIITMQCGPIRHTMTGANTADRELIVHETQFTTEEWGADGPSIQAIYGEIASDATRNADIAADISAAYREGRTCLALSNRIEHVETITKMLQDADVLTFALHGQLKTKERLTVRTNIAALSAETPFVLVATDKVAGEGFDLPQLDTLFLTVPISFKGRVVQQLGRVTRLNRETLLAAQVHDYRDSHVPLFDRMFRKRQRIIAKEGFIVRPKSPTT